MTDRPGLDFSFSGLKTQVLLAWRDSDQSDRTKADIARGFEDAVVDTLAIKCERALDAAGCDTWSSPAVSARTSACARNCRPWPNAAAAGSRSTAGAVHRQRRDDRLRRRAAAGRRPARRRRGAGRAALGHGESLPEVPGRPGSGIGGSGFLSARRKLPANPPSPTRSSHGQGLHRSARDRGADRHLRLGAAHPPALAVRPGNGLRQPQAGGQRRHRRHARLQGGEQAPGRVRVRVLVRAGRNPGRALRGHRPARVRRRIGEACCRPSPARCAARARWA